MGRECATPLDDDNDVSDDDDDETGRAMGEEDVQARGRGEEMRG